MLDEFGPPARALWREPLVEAEADRPRHQALGAHERRVEDVLFRIVGAAHEPVGKEDGEEWDEDRPEQVEEGQVVA